jgi:RNA polymerase sigma factor (sigma-70 family)
MAKKEFPSDQEIIELLKDSSGNLDIIYEKHKDYCMNFMKKINHNDELNQDVFHDALIVLNEKIKKEDFILNCSIQTYLNSICRNQILVRFKKNSKHSEYSEDYDVRIDDWYENLEMENNEKLRAGVTAFEKLKDLGGKCYEILRRFFYENHSMERIAYDMDYTNADNVKNQKSRCQKKLKELAFDLIKK